MRVTFTTRNASLTDREREYAEKKLQKLARHFRSAREAHLTHRTVRSIRQVEVQLDLDGVLIRAEERSPDFFAGIDAVAEKLERQVGRLKERLKDHKGRPDAPTVASLFTEVAAAESPEVIEPPRVVARRKRFAIKPMTVDEAALQMELLNHDFFAYLDAETDRVSILYRRQDAQYGILEMDV